MKRYFSSIKQYSWILLVSVLLAAIVGFIIARAQLSVYQVSSIVLVNKSAPGTTYPGGPTPGTATDSLAEALNYAAEIPTRSVMQYVINYDPKLRARGYTADDLIVDVVPSTSTTAATITLLATATHSSDAILLANDVANGFASYIQSQVQQELNAKRNDLNTQVAALQSQKDHLVGLLANLPNNQVPQYGSYTSNLNSINTQMGVLQNQLYNLPPTVKGDVFVIQSASPKDVTTSLKGYIIIGATAGVGLLVGFLIMLLLIFLDNRLRNDEQIKEKLGLAYLGGLSTNSEIKATPARPQGVAAHEISDIAANLRLTGVLPGSWQAPQGAVLLVTSPQVAEGKSTIAAALSATLARGGATVAVVDGNLRNPSTHLSFGIKTSGPGLSGLLRGAVGENVDDVVMRTNIPGVWLLPAGTAMDDATLLLEQKFPGIVRQLRRKTDIIIIDGPALLSSADASLLATMADGVALVIDTRHEKLPLMLRARELLESLTHTRAGVIMNRLAPKKHNNYYAIAYPSSTITEKWVAVQGYSNGNGQEVETMIAPPALRGPSPFPVNMPSPLIPSAPLSVPPLSGGMAPIPPGIVSPPPSNGQAVPLPSNGQGSNGPTYPIPDNDISMMQQNPSATRPAPRRVAMTPPPPPSSSGMDK